ncbi:hypothetical protein CISG_07706 [Coccidioides immitis RMSCC 3703]|uniref:Uncharacterized protein n=1 Tax=Coccidioides immitis RMSCC 3703 TaxID=454286 RepID=A0A0J8R4C3_COCIT|nr:hypothetical protein CISG_07706 [Coccidioides immitis RMSCC 3703]
MCPKYLIFFLKKLHFFSFTVLSYGLRIYALNSSVLFYSYSDEFLLPVLITVSELNTIELYEYVSHFFLLFYLSFVKPVPNSDCHFNYLDQTSPKVIFNV